MNIFATYPDPDKSAYYLDNKRAIKMILESAQIMATTMHFYGDHHEYKPTHKNHPCTMWAKKSKQNFLWLLEHFDALNRRYTKIYRRIHKCRQYMYMFYTFAERMPDRGLTPFVNCAKNDKLGLDFTHLPVHEAYRLYLHAKWALDKNPPKWG